MPPPQVSCWLGSFGDVVKVSSGTRRWHLRQVHQGTSLQALQATVPGINVHDLEDKIFGIVRLELVDVYHHLLTLPGLQRDQYNVWKDLLYPDLVGNLYGLRVVHCMALPAPRAYRHIEGVRSKGCIAELERGEPHLLAAGLGGVPPWAGLLPNLSLRLLPVQAALVARGLLDKIWLPDLHHLPGLRWWQLDFRKFGIRNEYLPLVPRYGEAGPG